MEYDKGICHARSILVGCVWHDYAKGIHVFLQGDPYLVVHGVVLSVLWLLNRHTVTSASYISVLIPYEIARSVHLYEILLRVLANTNDKLA